MVQTVVGKVDMLRDGLLYFHVLVAAHAVPFPGGIDDRDGGVRQHGPGRYYRQETASEYGVQAEGSASLTYLDEGGV